MPKRSATAGKRASINAVRPLEGRFIRLLEELVRAAEQAERSG